MEIPRGEKKRRKHERNPCRDPGRNLNNYHGSTLWKNLEEISEVILREFLKEIREESMKEWDKSLKISMREILKRNDSLEGY